MNTLFVVTCLLSLTLALGGQESDYQKWQRASPEERQEMIEKFGKFLKFKEMSRQLKDLKSFMQWKEQNQGGEDDEGEDRRMGGEDRRRGGEDRRMGGDSGERMDDNRMGGDMSPEGREKKEYMEKLAHFMMFKEKMMKMEKMNKAVETFKSFMKWKKMNEGEGRVDGEDDDEEPMKQPMMPKDASFEDILKKMKTDAHKNAMMITHAFLGMCKCQEGDMGMEMSKMLKEGRGNNTMGNDMGDMPDMPDFMGNNTAKAQFLMGLSKEQQKQMFGYGLVKSMCLGAKTFITKAKAFEETYMKKGNN